MDPNPDCIICGMICFNILEKRTSQRRSFIAKACDLWRESATIIQTYPRHRAFCVSIIPWCVRNSAELFPMSSGWKPGLDPHFRPGHTTHQSREAIMKHQCPPRYSGYLSIQYSKPIPFASASLAYVSINVCSSQIASTVSCSSN